MALQRSVGEEPLFLQTQDTRICFISSDRFCHADGFRIVRGQFLCFLNFNFLFTNGWICYRTISNISWTEGEQLFLISSTTCQTVFFAEIQTDRLFWTINLKSLNRIDRGITRLTSLRGVKQIVKPRHVFCKTMLSSEDRLWFDGNLTWKKKRKNDFSVKYFWEFLLIKTWIDEIKLISYDKLAL